MLAITKGILPACLVFIGGMNLAVGQPNLQFRSQDIGLVNTQVAFTPAERPQPQRTKGGGARLHELVDGKSNQAQLS
ncbi:MAG: hypothetical protein NW214_00520 [Pseudanabaenaceae cyanobacterium bins.39]|nr:hypothetical protein [Pseudanabaenaceae cyanobacterium bins.39]